MASKTRHESTTRSRREDEKSSLMSHEYDTVASDGDLSVSNSSQRNSRARSPGRTLEAQYSEIKREFIATHSRSVTPTDTSLVSEIREGVVSYGSVSANEEERYSVINGAGGDRRSRLSTTGSMSSHRLSTDVDGSAYSGHLTQRRVSTTILHVSHQTTRYRPPTGVCGHTLFVFSLLWFS